MDNISVIFGTLMVLAISSFSATVGKYRHNMASEVLAAVYIVPIMVYMVLRMAHTVAGMVDKEGKADRACTVYMVGMACKSVHTLALRAEYMVYMVEASDVGMAGNLDLVEASEVYTL